MEKNTNIIDPLLEQVEQFTKNQLELMKFQLLEKIGRFITQLITGLFFIAILSLCSVFLSITIAVWLGQILGKIYFGYLIVSLIYGLIAFIAWLNHRRIKATLNNWLVRKMFN